MKHVAAPEIVYHGRYLIQRCACCGFALVDDDLSRMSSTGGEGPTPFAFGAIVDVEGTAERRVSVVVGSVIEGSPDAKQFHEIVGLCIEESHPPF